MSIDQGIPVRALSAIIAIALLAGCGTDASSIDEEGSSENVEMPADEAVATIDELGGDNTATPSDLAAAAVAPSYTYGDTVSDEDTENDPPTYRARQYREPFNEYRAREKAETELAWETYRSIGRPYGCTIDCSGHEAGFKYRARKGYGSRIEGDYDARSFRQGQQAYDDEVDRRVEEARAEYENSEDEDY